MLVYQRVQCLRKSRMPHLDTTLSRRVGATSAHPTHWRRSYGIISICNPFTANIGMALWVMATGIFGICAFFPENRWRHGTRENWNLGILWAIQPCCSFAADTLASLKGVTFFTEEGIWSSQIQCKSPQDRYGSRRNWCLCIKKWPTTVPPGSCLPSYLGFSINGMPQSLDGL